jgi:hypothetical protein
MAITKIEYWIAVIFLVLVVSVSTMFVGQDLLKSNTAVLDDKSENYANQFASNLNSNQLNQYTNATEVERKNPLLTRLEGSPLIGDFLGAVNFFVNTGRSVIDFLAILYNIPTFILQGFGLPIAPFRHIINIIGVILLISITIVAMRLVK